MNAVDASFSSGTALAEVKAYTSARNAHVSKPSAYVLPYYRPVILVVTKRSNAVVRK